ncbi:MAG: 2'-5' RNA ligase family protein, partial [Gaiellales bacterium]
MRAFVAIPLPDALREELAAYGEHAARDLGARPIPAENLHATVHFLGSVRDIDAIALTNVLAPVCAAFPAFSLEVADAALAPQGRPRMVWARLESPEGLGELARALAAAAARLAPDARAPRTGNAHV